jgi:Kef-type K+ transport system membrane component KefB
VAPLLGTVAQLGVVLYMFLVGVEFDVSLLTGQAHASILISHASILLPFVLGTWLALYIYPILSPPTVPFIVFALFLGIAMSVTAFPVLARILTDRGLTRTRLGMLALTAAAVDDVTAWCLLALAVSTVRLNPAMALRATLLASLFAVFCLTLVRRILTGVMRCADHTGRAGATPLILAGALVAAVTTEAIGVHALFGAFIFGLAVPRRSAVAQSLGREVSGVATMVLLPAFFAYTGLRTELRLLSDWQNWAICAGIIAVASVGKVGGTLAAARCAGLGWRAAATLGALMNTRGLMELVVLNVGLDLGVISPTLFTMLVVMAIVTTVATTPVVDLLGPEASASGDDETRVPAPHGRAVAAAREYLQQDG